MLDIILILVIVFIVGASAAYIIREKKKGTKCIGCPVKECTGSCASCKKHCK